MTRAEEEEREALLRREHMRRAAEAEEERRAVEAAAFLEAQEKERERLQQIALDKAQHLERLKAAWLQKEAPSTPKAAKGSARKRKQDDDIYSDSEIAESNSEPQGNNNLRLQATG